MAMEANGRMSSQPPGVIEIPEDEVVLRERYENRIKALLLSRDRMLILFTKVRLGMYASNSLIDNIESELSLAEGKTSDGRLLEELVWNSPLCTTTRAEQKPRAGFFIGNKRGYPTKEEADALFVKWTKEHKDKDALYAKWAIEHGHNPDGQTPPKFGIEYVWENGVRVEKECANDLP